MKRRHFITGMLVTPLVIPAKSDSLPVRLSPGERVVTANEAWHVAHNELSSRLIVEDGTGKPDANSYLSLEECDEYHRTDT